MSNDPYTKIAKSIKTSNRKEFVNGCSVFIGEVIAKSPLMFRVNGLDLTKDNFYIKYGLNIEEMEIGSSVIAFKVNTRQYVIMDRVVKI